MNLRFVLIRLNQIMRGWSAYFKHAVTKHTFDTITRDAAPLMRGRIGPHGENRLVSEVGAWNVVARLAGNFPPPWTM